jgi:hypothetical protein
MPEISTPTSTSSYSENDALTLADEIKKYNTVDFIDFLRSHAELELDEEDLGIIHKRKINGRTFFKMNKQEFRECGLEIGPAITLMDFAKECKVKKLKSFSSYKTIEDAEKVFSKYGVNESNIRSIPYFTPPSVKIDDKDEDLELCINMIKIKMKTIGTTTSSNETVRCEYISAILCASVAIAKRITEQKIQLDPQFRIVGNEASGRVDYAISRIKDAIIELIAAVTEGKQKDLLLGFLQNVMQLESSYHTNTKKRKLSEAFSDSFDYLYGVVTTGMYDFPFHICSKSENMVLFLLFT